MEWEGKDRRRSERPESQDMHDTLIRIDANLSNFMKRFEDHSEEDSENFEKTDKRIEKITEVQEDLRKYVWIGIGGLAVLQFIIIFLKK